MAVQRPAASSSGPRDLPDPAYDIDPVEASRNQHYDQPYRPQFHYSALQGHIGDATGLIYHQGEYHLFSMFDQWERRRNRHKCWGHATSRDCVHWEAQPPILDPLVDHKPGSGSGIVDWNDTLALRAGPYKTLAVFYTDYVRGSCLAYSTDAGRTWIRHPSNPVLAGVDDIRDPTVFWYAPASAWRMVRYERQGFVFYGSSDLLNWVQLSRVEGRYECPDLFELPVEDNSGERKWVLTAANGAYMLGSFDGRHFTAETDTLRIERGKAFYAPQTWKRTPEGGSPVIQIAFLRYPDEPRLTWHCQMAFPCVLTLRRLPEGVRLCRLPIDEIKNLRIAQDVWRNVTLSPGQNPLGSMRGDLFDIRAEIEVLDAAAFRFDVRGQAIHYSRTDEQLRVAGTAIPLKPSAGRVRLQVLVDRSSIEVFVDRGQATISNVTFFDPVRDDYCLTAEGGDIRVISLEINELEGIWPRPAVGNVLRPRPADPRNGGTGV